MKKTKKLNLEVFQEEVDKKESKTFCSHLFTGLSLSQKGTARVCCNNYEVPKGVDGEELSFYSKDFNVSDVFNSDLHTRIRKNIFRYYNFFSLLTLILSLNFFLRSTIFRLRSSPTETSLHTFQNFSYSGKVFKKSVSLLLSCCVKKL